MKKYFVENFLEKLRKLAFPNYLTYAYANDAYSHFMHRFAKAINLIVPAKRIRLQNLGLITKSCYQYKDGINSMKL